MYFCFSLFVWSLNLDVAVAEGRAFNLQYNDASMNTTGVEMQPTLPITRSLFCTLRGFKKCYVSSCDPFAFSTGSRLPPHSFKRFLFLEVFYIVVNLGLTYTHGGTQVIFLLISPFRPCLYRL